MCCSASAIPYWVHSVQLRLLTPRTVTRHSGIALNNNSVYYNEAFITVSQCDARLLILYSCVTTEIITDRLIMSDDALRLPDSSILHDIRTTPLLRFLSSIPPLFPPKFSFFTPFILVHYYFRQRSRLVRSGNMTMTIVTLPVSFLYNLRINVSLTSVLFESVPS